MNTLYRFFAADDQLLYVGLTVNPGRRLEKHRSIQPWWSDVARVEMEQHPDLTTLRAAEREAIEAERPLHNIRMNSQGPANPHTIIWVCDICGNEISDNSGYITIDYTAIFRYEAWHTYFDEANRRKAAEDGHTWAFYSLGELAGSPDLPRWRALHERCDPDVTSNDYWIAIERIRTLPQVLSWTAHLLGKKWIQHTNWSSFIRSLAERIEPGTSLS